MIRFLNGPAEKHALMLKRAPLFLRVTFDGKEWDGLDQIEDSPRIGEQLFTYRRKGQSGMCHILIRSKTRSGGFFATGQYEFVKPQPLEEIMRDNTKWQQWTREQVKK